ncbi:CoA-transferase [Sulfitobacter dubius]|uniref:Glutaconate CoA-transferase subunit B n=1 Tax=Sulfitobacter dubius TaxID=218673 RepID=A0ABY3ZRC3_9RHOB|nr:CoA-transferase [Sulfitobacter dubius]UOA17194.1 Glutaconate CoA-transferase subunit B [Sulfitobacter dubius]
MTEYTSQELQAIILARDLKDGEMGAAGAAAAIPMAAILLARQTHAPNLVIAGEMFVNPNPTQLWPSMLDDRALGACEAAETFLELFGHSHRGLDFFFHNGLQIDARGNINLHYVGGSLHAPKVRGPGAANISYAGTSKRFYICPTAHSKRNFVERVEFITSPGYLDGPESFAESGLKGGPSLCVSPLAVMDFCPDTLRMRLKSAHEGVSVEEVQSNTGFKLIVSDEVPTTPAPSDNELRLLREKVDTKGYLRR